MNQERIVSGLSVRYWFEFTLHLVMVTRHPNPIPSNSSAQNCLRVLLIKANRGSKFDFLIERCSN